MKKLIISIVGAVLLALLGIMGLNHLKKAGPRERVVSPSGSRIIVEEMSYYIGGDKFFGKLFKPADENGNFPDSIGPMPIIVYFHEPLKTDWPESVVKSLVPDGIIGYTTGFRGKDKDAANLLKRISKEAFAMPGMMFVVSDASCGDQVVNAVARLGHKIQGLALVEPALTGKANETYQRYGREFLTIGTEDKGDAVSLIEDYLEERGALK
ncbi:MAG: hypothetical protein IJK05_02620 [Bacteroidales bacterium]|nr:hypothetical protein [Bacteroidales bacterium]